MTTIPRHLGRNVCVPETMLINMHTELYWNGRKVEVQEYIHPGLMARLKLCMTFTVKFYDVLLLCSDSNVLPSRESDPSMQMCFVLLEYLPPFWFEALS